VSRGLLLSVRFHDGRYHGAGDWPPAPFRLFQALVAGAAAGGCLAEGDKAALAWLESLAAPVIAVPAVRLGRGYNTFVPNNDLDTVDGDPRRVGEIRSGKNIRPRLFNAEIPFLYVWSFAADQVTEDQAKAVCAIAERLYQLGRGIDMAWAWAEILDAKEIEVRLAAYDGTVHRPGKGDRGTQLLCPRPGSLASLTSRFDAMRRRFSKEGKQQLFTQPPRPRFAPVLYDSPPRQYMFDLRAPDAQADFVPWPFTKVVALVEHVRDSAANRLRQAQPDKVGEIDLVFIGRDATEADKLSRLKITPLPSIGHQHAGRAIRRVLIEIPTDCPLRASDIAWSFSGLPIVIDKETGEVQSLLMAAEDEGMLRHFGRDDAFSVWRTVTPAALPQTAARRRIEPARLRERAGQKDASERIGEETRAAAAVHQALRHAGIDAAVTSIRVQREPFEGKGARAEAFAPGTRFAKERLWQVEIALAKPVRGPLLIGDGRYLGLGLLAPARQTQAIFAFVLEGAKPASGQEGMIAHAARRAVMARVQERLGRDKALSSFFSGHEDDGAPMRRGHHAHLFYAVDLLNPQARLLIIAPHTVEHREASNWERESLKELEQSLAGFDELRAGKAGLFKLTALSLRDDDPLCDSSLTWVSATPYRPTRHPKRKDDIENALIADVLTECARRNLPRPEVEVLSCDLGPRGGVQAYVRLVFAVGIEGPVLLGQGIHEGFGLFEIKG
jgi:CRISPR-associated protein Csb2